MSKIRVACVAISKRINAGRVNKAGDAFIGAPVDVTSDCLKAVIEKVGAGQSVTITEDDKPAFEITVRDVRATVMAAEGWSVPADQALTAMTRERDHYFAMYQKLETALATTPAVTAPDMSDDQIVAICSEIFISDYTIAEYDIAIARAVIRALRSQPKGEAQ